MEPAAPVEDPELEFLGVTLKTRVLAFPVPQVSEVLIPASVTPVPHLPAHVRGVVNRHGQVTAVLDLSVLLGAEIEEAPSRLVVIASGALAAAIPVTRVTGIITLRRSAIEPPLPHLRHELNFISGQIARGDEVISVIDGAVLLESARHRRHGA
jgi:chemotaxis signal transduction protein